MFEQYYNKKYEEFSKSDVTEKWREHHLKKWGFSWEHHLIMREVEFELIRMWNKRRKFYVRSRS